MIKLRIKRTGKMQEMRNAYTAFIKIREEATQRYNAI
jgi:hypothetical protein